MRDAWELFVQVCQWHGQSQSRDDVFPESAFLRQVFSRLFPSQNKMSFEDVEERDGVQFVNSRPGGFGSSIFQAFDCRGTFGLHLALRPIAPWYQSQLFTSR